MTYVLTRLTKMFGLFETLFSFSILFRDLPDTQIQIEKPDTLKMAHNIGKANFYLKKKIVEGGGVTGKEFFFIYNQN